MRRTTLDVGSVAPNRLPPTLARRGGAQRPGLNRATLARQLLLERVAARSAVGDRAPGRTAGAGAHQPARRALVSARRLRPRASSTRCCSIAACVRSAALRGTIHLLTAADCLAIWPLCQPVLSRSCATIATSRRCCAASISTRRWRGRAGIWSSRGRSRSSSPRWGSGSPIWTRRRWRSHAATGWRWCRCRRAVMWGRSNQVTVATAEAWLGEPLDRSLAPADLVTALPRRVRPGTARRHGDVVAPDRACLRVRRRRGPTSSSSPTSAGATCFDVPHAPRPDPATPAPVRFLPEYDNVLLSHADRARFCDQGRAGALSARPARPRPRARRRHAPRRRGSSATAASRCSTSSCHARDRDEVRHAAIERLGAARARARARPQRRGLITSVAGRRSTRSGRRGRRGRRTRRWRCAVSRLPAGEP